MRQINEHLAQLEILQYQELGFLIEQYTQITNQGGCMRRFLNALKDILLEQQTFCQQEDSIHLQLIFSF